MKSILSNISARVTAIVSVSALALGTAALAAGSGSAEAARPAGAGLKTYTAELTMLNPQVSGGTGTATVTLRGGALTVDLNVDGLDDTVHLQHIHFGPRCPDPAPNSEDDTNGDGYVDVIEGLADYGGIFVNLDDDLSDPGMNSFPSGSSYSYHAVGSRSDIQDSSGHALKLGRRHIVIHGASEDLPDSVQTLPGLPPESNSVTLPVACGDLVQVK